jgi:hypothetical protein
MFKRLTASMLLSTAILSTSVRAQIQAQTQTPTQTQTQNGPSADEQAIRTQLQEAFQTIMQNMQAKGIDPMQFFQQMQNGADPADIQKQLVDRGIIDQETLTKMQTNMQKLVTGRIRDQLDVTDSEWEALAPLVQNVMADMAAVNRTGGGMGGAMAGFMTTQSPAAANLAKASRELRAALQDPTVPAQEVASLLRTYRDARSKVQDELAAARIELSSVLTLRQEATLSALGLLE